MEHLLRKLLHDFVSKAVVAVACERELLSGIYDSGIIPVFGIVNIRAYGPCFNTSVNIDELQSAIENFLGPNPNK